MKKGFWNGIEPITYRVVNYLVLPGKVKTWWQNRCVFEVRQGILVTTQGNYTFLIDNKHGDGFYKIQSGGDPQVGHKSIDEYEIKSDVEEKDIVINVDKKGLQKEHQEHLEWIKKEFPEEYKKTEALLKMIKK